MGEDEGVSEQVRPASSGARRTVVNMFRSLVPLTVLIVILVVVFQPGHRTSTPTVNPAPDFSYVASQLRTAVPRPHGLAKGWRSTSSDVASAAPGRAAASVDVGYLTPGGNFARLVESGRPAAAVVRAELGSPTRAGAVTIAGRTWARYRTDRGELVLAATLGRIGVMVTGNASLAEQRTLAGSLH